MTWTRRAKCSDCKYLLRRTEGRTHFTCDNPSSPHHNQRRTLKDLVCDVWKYIFE